MKLIWGRVHSGGCIYALKFSNGSVKVGKSRHLGRRFDTHLMALRARGAHLVDWWFSKQLDDYSATETLAINAAESLMTHESGRTGREWFHNIDFEKLMFLISALDACAPSWPSMVDPA